VTAAVEDRHQLSLLETNRISVSTPKLTYNVCSFGAVSVTLAGFGRNCSADDRNSPTVDTGEPRSSSLITITTLVTGVSRHVKYY